MPNYMLVDADQLDAGLKSIADSIRAKGGTSAQLSFPDELKAAVDAIVTNSGVTIQRATGTLRTDSSGAATVNCGFKPDFVIVRSFSNSELGSSYEGQLACSFTEKASNKTGTYSISIDSSNYYIYCWFVQKSNGFSVDMTKSDPSYNVTTNSNASYSYIAVKYTE